MIFVTESGTMQATITMLIKWPLPVMAIFANEPQAMVVPYIMMAVPFLSRNTFTTANYDEAGDIFFAMIVFANAGLHYYCQYMNNDQMVEVLSSSAVYEYFIVKFNNVFLCKSKYSVEGLLLERRPLVNTKI